MRGCVERAVGYWYRYLEDAAVGVIAHQFCSNIATIYQVPGDTEH